MWLPNGKMSGTDKLPTLNSRSTNDHSFFHVTTAMMDQALCWVPGAQRHKSWSQPLRGSRSRKATENKEPAMGRASEVP